MPDTTERPEPDAAGEETNTDDATIQAEEDEQDADTAREAMDEALREGAVPWERVKEDGGE